MLTASPPLKGPLFSMRPSQWNYQEPCDGHEFLSNRYSAWVGNVPSVTFLEIFLSSPTGTAPFHRNRPACLPSGCGWSSQVHPIPLEQRNICRGIGKGSFTGVVDGTVCVHLSWGCHNQVPQSRWLKTIEIYSLTAQEAGSPKSRCWQCHAASETRRAILPCFFLLSHDSLTCRHVIAISACLHMVIFL